MTHEEVIDRVFDALRKAEKLHPGFPTDPIHASAIVTEELGELERAALQWTYEESGKAAVAREAAHTAAMGIRFLLNIDNMVPRPSEQV